MKENRWKTWWRRERGTCLRAAVLACLPVIACLVCCAARGQGIGQVYLPSSERNDELIYYKQVEAILEYGYPRGYFGFNESHALKLSFAAWSPALMLPWVLWGLLFGWNLLSPVLCNLFLLAGAMLLYGMLAKPDWKQTGIISLLFFLYMPFSWYMLCGMPEIGCMSLAIVFYGAAAGWLRRRRGGLLAVMFALAGLLTLMRPYFLLFLLLPAYFWIFRDAAGGSRGMADSGGTGSRPGHGGGLRGGAGGLRLDRPFPGGGVFQASLPDGLAHGLFPKRIGRRTEEPVWFPVLFRAGIRKLYEAGDGQRASRRGDFLLLCGDAPDTLLAECEGCCGSAQA